MLAQKAHPWTEVVFLSTGSCRNLIQAPTCQKESRVTLAKSLFQRVGMGSQSAKEGCNRPDKKKKKSLFSSVCSNCHTTWIRKIVLPSSNTWSYRLNGLRQRFFGLFIYCKLFPTASGLMKLWFLTNGHPEHTEQRPVMLPSLSLLSVLVFIRTVLGSQKEHSGSLQSQSTPLLKFLGVEMVQEPGYSW